MISNFSSYYSGLLIYPHIVDHILQGKSRHVDSFTTAPTSAKGEIEQQIEIFGIRPVGIGIGSSTQNGGLQLPVDEPKQPIGVPLKGIDMPNMLIDLYYFNENGMMYEKYKDLELKVKELLDNKKLRAKLSKNAYEYITQKWTSSIAAENLIELFEAVMNGKESKIKDGPASKAKKI